jgi:D-glycero-D-manno-heptose 1,7-bisphosphate phosphatase
MVRKKQNFKKVVFLDRDGVINRDSPEYIKSWSEFEFLPGSLEAIQQLTSKGFAIIVITNQSAINRKLISKNELEHMHRLMEEDVRSHGGRIDDIFYCPHIPEDGCDCRKPKPGLIFSAREAYSIDLASSIMIGDSVRDIACARNAGCGKAILVKTGYGIKTEKRLSRQGISADFIADDLYGAVEWINRIRV